VCVVFKVRNHIEKTARLHFWHSNTAQQWTDHL